MRQGDIHARRAWRRGFAILLAAGSLGAMGGEPFDEALYTVGAVRHDGSGKAWAFVSWQGGDMLPPSGPGAKVSAYAVYARSGGPAEPSPFKLLGIARRQTDPLILNGIVASGVPLGDDPDLVGKTIGAFFPGDGTALSTSQKLAAIVGTAAKDAEQNEHLLLLARRFPTVAMAAGTGWVSPLEGLSTFEVRAYDVTTHLDLAVVGRVTLDAANPPVLPRPGPPVAVADLSPMGHLNVKLRWGMTADLAPLALASQGFAVFRYDRSFAELRGYDQQPPPAALVLSDLGAHPTMATRLGSTPILASSAMTVEQAADPAFAAGEFFIIDDNGRFDGGVPFVAGTEYYYFVAALDALGQPGLLSTGSLVKVCDTLAPNPPAGVQVENDYRYLPGAVAGVQRLQVTWEQPHNSAKPVRYHVYRAASPEALQLGAADLGSNRIAGPIMIAAGEARGGFLDNGAGAPDASKDAGASYWYAVRVEEQGACGAKYSPLSTPVFGVLRNRAGPVAPEGSIQIQCVQPLTSWTSTFDEDYRPGGRDGDPPPVVPGEHRYHVVCEAANFRASWVEIYLETGLDRANILAPDPATWVAAKPAPDPTNPDPVLDGLNPAHTIFFGRREFSKGLPATFEMDVRLAADPIPERNKVRWACRVGASDGRISSAVATTDIRTPTEATIRTVRFSSVGEAQAVALRPPSGDPPDASLCQVHHPMGSEGVVGIQIGFTLTPRTREYRLYRCVENGTMTLIKQDAATFDPATPDWKLAVVDSELPAHGGNLCYHVQLLDQDGNASPLVYLGQVPVLSILEPPRPQMLTPEKTPEGHRIKWFCPPTGVDRFEIWISAEPGGLGPQPLSPALSKDLAPKPNLRVMDNAGMILNEVRVYHTGPATKMGPGPLYQLDLATEKGKTYRVRVLAVGAHSQLGVPSKSVSLKGEYLTIIPPSQAKVPWPARPLPPVRSANPGMAALRLPDGIHSGLAIRVGTFQMSVADVAAANRGASTDFLSPPYAIGAVPASFPIAKQIYKDADGNSLFPGVLYRIQVSSGAGAVPRRVTQVSPMVEDFRMLEGSVPASGLPIWILADPMFRMVVQSISGQGENAIAQVGIYLLDHQPGRVFGRYAYQWLCHVPSSREISRTLTIGPADLVPAASFGGMPQ